MVLVPLYNQKRAFDLFSALYHVKLQGEVNNLELRRGSSAEVNDAGTLILDFQDPDLGK